MRVTMGKGFIKFIVSCHRSLQFNPQIQPNNLSQLQSFPEEHLYTLKFAHPDFKMKVFTALVNLALASSAVAVAVDSRATLPGFEERACGTTGGRFMIASPA